jgi:hypothetical protein
MGQTIYVDGFFIESIEKMARDSQYAVQAQELFETSEAFRRNLTRVTALAKMPFVVMDYVRRETLLRSTYDAEVAKTMRGEGVDHATAAQLVCDRARENQDAIAQIWRMRIAPGLVHFATDDDEEVAKGAISALEAMIVGIWTAIETLAGDLWTAAVDAHPHTLAALTGSPKRIAQQPAEMQVPNEATASQRRDSKQISLNAIRRITHDRYDIHDKMGRLLRENKTVTFTTLADIRVAYSLAFSDQYVDVDAALASDALDALSAIRNAIIHKAGMADAEYQYHQQHGPLLPVVVLNQPIPITGDLVSRLTIPAIQSGRALLTAVDAWLRIPR